MLALDSHVKHKMSPLHFFPNAQPTSYHNSHKVKHRTPKLKKRKQQQQQQPNKHLILAFQKVQISVENKWLSSD